MSPLSRPKYLFEAKYVIGTSRHSPHCGITVTVGVQADIDQPLPTNLDL
jgi:hypothetical protein